MVIFCNLLYVIIIIINEFHLAASLKRNFRAAFVSWFQHSLSKVLMYMQHYSHHQFQAKGFFQRLTIFSWIIFVA